MSKFKFYSKEELSKLRQIKSLPDKKSIKEALEQFCTENKRKYSNVRLKMSSLNKGRNTSTVNKASVSQTQVRINFTNVEVNMEEKYIAFNLIKTH